MSDEKFIRRQIVPGLKKKQKVIGKQILKYCAKLCNASTQLQKKQRKTTTVMDGQYKTNIARLE